MVSEIKIPFIFPVRDATVPKLHSATSEAKILSDGEFKVSYYQLFYFSFTLVSAQTKVTYSESIEKNNNAETPGSHKKSENRDDAFI